MAKEILKITQWELDMIDLFKKKDKNECSIEQIAFQTGYSDRQIRRKYNNYKKYGPSSLIHGNQGKRPSNKIDEVLEQKIVQKYLDEYQVLGTSFAHYAEIVEQELKIKADRQKIKNIMERNGIISPYATKKTKKEFEKKLENEKKKEIVSVDGEDFELVESVSVEDFDPHPRRPRSASTGYLLQMDTGFFDAPNDTDGKWAVHVAIDDATNLITGLYFGLQETTNGYFHVMDQTLRKYGAPKNIVTDKRSTFCVNRKKKSSFENDFLTNFEMTCQHYCINLHVTSIPQQKGRVERIIGTIKKRIRTELHLQNITTLEQANAFAQDFINDLNNKFALHFNNIKSSWRNVDTDEIEYHLCKHFIRTVGKGNVIYMNNEIYYTSSDGRNINIVPGRKGLVIETFKGKLLFYCCGKYYEMLPVPEHMIDNHSHDGISRNPRFPATEEQKRRHSYSCFYVDQLKYVVKKQKHLTNSAKKSVDII